VSTAKEPPPPLEANDMLVAGSLTAGWAIALVVLLIVGLPARDGWWIWTCVVGLVLGLFGIWYVPYLKRGRERAAAARAAVPASTQRDSGSNTVSSTDTPGSSTKS
jgi:hypothetical protein